MVDNEIEDDGDDWVEHPVVSLWNSWKKTPVKKRQNIDLSPHREAFHAFFLEMKEEATCKDVNQTGRLTNCTCMHDLILPVDQVVIYMVRFSTMTKVERRKIIAEWIRYADAFQFRGGNRHYLLPGSHYPICQHAMARLVGLKSYAWRGLCQKVRNGDDLNHGLFGKEGNKSDSQALELVDSFLFELQEQGQPRATRVVRYLNKEKQYVQELRDENENVIDLPSHCTRLGLYKEFCRKHGWMYLYDPKNRILDKVPIEGAMQDPSDVNDLPSIKTFVARWDDKFPHMRIQKAAADICDDCFRFANQVRYRQNLTGKEGREALLDAGPYEETISADSIKDQEEEIYQAESLIKLAAKHVDMQEKQRALFQKVKRHSFELAKSVSKISRVHTFVADFAQNMGVPNLAGEQPGEAYYLSPLGGFVFGVVDCCSKPVKLAAHTYFETDGKKGGNNVTSMLWNELTRKGLTQVGEGFVNEINIVMDNCRGQNKNRMVIRLLFVLISRKVCFRARLIFLIKGHTKNDCDRMFNLMKKEYRNSNCYTPKQLLEFVGRAHEDVECINVVEDGGFKDWDAYEDKYMEHPTGIVNHHIFTVTQQKPDRLMCQEAAGYPIVFKDNIVREQFRGTSWADHLLEELQPLEPIGMKDIKWKTLYDKWRPLVPLEHRKDYYYYCNDPGSQRRDKIKANTGAAKAARLGRSITTDGDIDKKKTSKKPNKKGKASTTTTKKTTKKPPASKKPTAKQKKPTAKQTKKPAAKQKKPAAKRTAKKKGTALMEVGNL